MNNLEVLFKNNILYYTDLISNFVSNYPFKGKINLLCSDQTISLNHSFKNINIGELYLNRTNLNFANKVDKKVVSYINLLVSNGYRRFSEDLCLLKII